MVKEKQLTINEISKLAHYCNFSRISFFKSYVKETVAAVVFMFELNLLRILGSINYVFWYPLFALKCGISDVIYNLMLYLFREDIKMLFR